MSDDENAPGACGMILVSPGLDGMGHEQDCLRPAIGTTEDKVRVCAECARGMVEEGFRVDYDAPWPEGGRP